MTIEVGIDDSMIREYIFLHLMFNEVTELSGSLWNIEIVYFKQMKIIVIDIIYVFISLFR